MAALNPMQLMLALKNGNPKQVAQQIIQTNYPNDPAMINLMQMAERGDIQGLQKVAENVLGPQGKNFQQELQNLFYQVQTF